MHFVVGTAGHIDHGKTALVKALTGVDADRLPEEKRRGITVDLGFAEMSVGETHFAFVDVPGHERFVKNMLAGASGIDLVLLVIAADEGVMPQTREHFDICRLLGVNAGIVVLTKSDLVDPETLELAKLDAAELVAGSFLEDAPVLAVSSRTKDGIDELKKSLVARTHSLAKAEDRLVARLPIDRSFSMKGFGAVVTGTLASGEIVEGDEFELMPSGEKVRVRGLQTHGKSVKSVFAGQRVAVNLAGIEHSKIVRGMTLTTASILQPTQIIDAEIEVLADAAKPLRTRQRVRVHLGTSETLARMQVLNSSAEITAGEKDFAQIRFELPVVAVAGERFIIRSYSPQTTIAGGVVIDTYAPKHRRADFDEVSKYLSNLLSAQDDHTAKVNLLVGAAGTTGSSFAELQSRIALKSDVLKSAIDENINGSVLVAAGERFITTKNFDALKNSVESTINKFHKSEPLAKGISRETLRENASPFVPVEVFNAVITGLHASGDIIIDRDVLRLTAHKTELSDVEANLSDKILTSYLNARLEPPRLDEALDAAIAGTRFLRIDARKFFQLHLDTGNIVKVTGEFYFAKSVIDKLVAQLRAFADTSSDRLIDVAKFKELAVVTRKYAIPLLEYFDREKVTQRAGDKRMIL